MPDAPSTAAPALPPDAPTTPAPVVHPARAALATKLARIMGSVPNIPKNGWNDHFKYAFATEADVSAALQQRFASENIIVLPGATNARREGKLTIVDMTFTVIDGDTGHCELVQWSGNGEDNGDKALWKAITGGVKYFLMKLVLAPTGDDPEATDADGRSTRKAPRRGQQQPQRQPPPDNAARNPNDPARITEAEAKRLRDMVKTHGVDREAFREGLKKHFGYASTNDIAKRDYDLICRAITEGTGLATAAAERGR